MSNNTPDVDRLSTAGGTGNRRVEDFATTFDGWYWETDASLNFCFFSKDLGGSGITPALETTSSQNLKLGLEDVVSRVEDGEQLGEAFARHPKIFNDMAVNMAKAGTEGGFLEDALERVSVFTEQQSELKSRTIGALIYPAILATMGTGVVAVLLVFFVPKFSVMFDQLRAKGELPIFTEYLLATSGFLNKYGLIFFVVLAVLYFVFRVQLRSEAGKRMSDRVKLKMPMFGMIFRNLAVSRFCS